LRPEQKAAATEQTLTYSKIWQTMMDVQWVEQHREPAVSPSEPEQFWIDKLKAKPDEPAKRKTGKRTKRLF